MDKTSKMPVDFMVAPGTLASESLTLVWDKPIEHENITGYIVCQNDVIIAQTNAKKTYFSVKGLKADTIYEFHVESVINRGDRYASSSKLQVRTKSKSIVNLFSDIRRRTYDYYINKDIPSLLEPASKGS